MARVKNVSGEALDVPALGRVVQPGEIVDVDSADGYANSELWQVTTSKKSDKTEENA